MKKSIILIVGMLVALYAHANEKYMEAMQKGMEKLSQAESPESFLEASNTFARIAELESEKWMPAYYAAYSSTIYAAMTNNPDVMDKYLDRAEEYVESASQISADNSEILALHGFIHMLRISVDPQTRGQEYSGKSGMMLAKAKELDPNNPRVLYLQAQLSYGTAQFFGQDGSEACALNKKALELFDTTSSDEPFYPSWGKEMSLGFQERCK